MNLPPGFWGYFHAVVLLVVVWYVWSDIMHRQCAYGLAAWQLLIKLSHEPNMVDSSATILALAACVILWLCIWEVYEKHLLPLLLVCIGVAVMVWASFFMDGPSEQAYLFKTGRGGAYFAGCLTCLWSYSTFRKSRFS